MHGSPQKRPVPAIHRTEPHTLIRLDPRARLPAFPRATTRVLRLRESLEAATPQRPVPPSSPRPAGPDGPARDPTTARVGRLTLLRCGFLVTA